MRWTGLSTLLACAVVLARVPYALASHSSTRLDGEEALADDVDLPTALAVALRNDPALRALDLRTEAALARVRGAAGLPDPQLRYQLWNAPLARPLSPEMHMLGLSQEFPVPGSRAWRIDAAERAVAIERETRRARAEQVATEVRKAFAAYYQADRELDIRREHLALTRRIVELARASYQVSRASQSDVLRLRVELSRRESELAGVEQQRRSSQALLNTLIGRDADAPLGPPADLPPAAALEPPGDLAARPEVAGAQAAVAQAHAQLRAVEREAQLPSFMVGLDYMYSPMAPERHGYAAMVGVSLPWLSGRREGAAREARCTLAAAQAAVETARLAARFQWVDAAARAAAARRGLEALDAEQLPLARQSYEAARAGFTSGRTDAAGVLDAERVWLAARLEREAALARYFTARADLERAAGAATPVEAN